MNWVDVTGCVLVLGTALGVTIKFAIGENDPFAWAILIILGLFVLSGIVDYRSKK